MSQPELYFDISSEESGGSLFRLRNTDGSITFLYDHSTYDEKKDEVKVFKTPYSSFALFWQELSKNKEWFYLHPLFVHPEVRAFVQAQLQHADWSLQGDGKWQESHRRQWKKVLTDPGTYYQPGRQ